VEPDDAEPSPLLLELLLESSELELAVVPVLLPDSD
jgi:hypothetical protein